MTASVIRARCFAGRAQIMDFEPVAGHNRQGQQDAHLEMIGRVKGTEDRRQEICQKRFWQDNLTVFVAIDLQNRTQTQQAGIAAPIQARAASGGDNQSGRIPR